MAASVIPIFRFYSETNRTHFYTSSAAERDSIISRFSPAEWRYEGEAFSAFNGPTSAGMAIYRFYSESRRTHFYTSNSFERDMLIESFPVDVWRYEGIAFFAVPPGTAGSPQIHRFYSPSSNTHFYTASAAEAASIQRRFSPSVWRYEGIAFAVPAG